VRWSNGDKALRPINKGKGQATWSPKKKLEKNEGKERTRKIEGGKNEGGKIIPSSAAPPRVHIGPGRARTKHVWRIKGKGEAGPMYQYKAWVGGKLVEEKVHNKLDTKRQHKKKKKIKRECLSDNRGKKSLRKRGNTLKKKKTAETRQKPVSQRFLFTGLAKRR